ncbi:MAG: hypothetical protein JW994_07595, partial [Candidatus Omnitrophica bacterium]|nr:hypothetical protein [Candidatus Omnitrophota bacterium]
DDRWQQVLDIGLYENTEKDRMRAAKIHRKRWHDWNEYIKELEGTESVALSKKAKSEMKESGPLSRVFKRALGNAQSAATNAIPGKAIMDIGRPILFVSAAAIMGAVTQETETENILTDSKWAYGPSAWDHSPSEMGVTSAKVVKGKLLVGTNLGPAMKKGGLSVWRGNPQNLEGRTITLTVDVPAEFAGDGNNCIRIYTKDSRGRWQDSGWTGRGEVKKSGKCVLEYTPDSRGGYTESGYNPRSVMEIGLCFELNKEAKNTCDKPITVQSLTVEKKASEADRGRAGSPWRDTPRSVEPVTADTLSQKSGQRTYTKEFNPIGTDRYDSGDVEQLLATPGTQKSIFLSFGCKNNSGIIYDVTRGVPLKWRNLNLAIAQGKDIVRRAARSKKMIGLVLFDFTLGNDPNHDTDPGHPGIFTDEGTDNMIKLARQWLEGVLKDMPKEERDAIAFIEIMNEPDNAKIPWSSVELFVTKGSGMAREAVPDIPLSFSIGHVINAKPYSKMAKAGDSFQVHIYPDTLEEFPGRTLEEKFEYIAGMLDVPSNVTIVVGEIPANLTIAGRRMGVGDILMAAWKAGLAGVSFWYDNYKPGLSRKYDFTVTDESAYEKAMETIEGRRIPAAGRSTAEEAPEASEIKESKIPPGEERQISSPEPSVTLPSKAEEPEKTSKEPDKSALTAEKPAQGPRIAEKTKTTEKAPIAKTGEKEKSTEPKETKQAVPVKTKLEKPEGPLAALIKSAVDKAKKIPAESAIGFKRIERAKEPGIPEIDIDYSRGEITIYTRYERKGDITYIENIIVDMEGNNPQLGRGVMLGNKKDFYSESDTAGIYYSTPEDADVANMVVKLTLDHEAGEGKVKELAPIQYENFSGVITLPEKSELFPQDSVTFNKGSKRVTMPIFDTKGEKVGVSYLYTDHNGRTRLVFSIDERDKNKNIWVSLFNDNRTIEKTEGWYALLNDTKTGLLPGKGVGAALLTESDGNFVRNSDGTLKSKEAKFYDVETGEISYIAIEKYLEYNKDGRPKLVKRIIKGPDGEKVKSESDFILTYDDEGRATWWQIMELIGEVETVYCYFEDEAKDLEIKDDVSVYLREKNKYLLQKTKDSKPPKSAIRVTVKKDRNSGKIIEVNAVSKSELIYEVYPNDPGRPMWFTPYAKEGKFITRTTAAERDGKTRPTKIEERETQEKGDNEPETEIRLSKKSIHYNKEGNAMYFDESIKELDPKTGHYIETKIDSSGYGRDSEGYPEGIDKTVIDLNNNHEVETSKSFIRYDDKHNKRIYFERESMRIDKNTGHRLATKTAYSKYNKEKFSCPEDADKTVRDLDDNNKVVETSRAFIIYDFRGEEPRTYFERESMRIDKNTGHRLATKTTYLKYNKEKFGCPGEADKIVRDLDDNSKIVETSHSFVVYDKKYHKPMFFERESIRIDRETDHRIKTTIDYSKYDKEKSGSPKGADKTTEDMETGKKTTSNFLITCARGEAAWWPLRYGDSTFEYPESERDEFGRPKKVKESAIDFETQKPINVYSSIEISPKGTIRWWARRILMGDYEMTFKYELQDEDKCYRIATKVTSKKVVTKKGNTEFRKVLSESYDLVPIKIPSTEEGKEEERIDWRRF